MKKIILFLFMYAMFSTVYGQLIIDHNHRDITTLTEAEINLAKSKLHIAYGHTSHGSQITTGMSGLVAFANGGGKGLSLPNDIFKWNDGILSGTLDLDDYAMGGDVGSFPDWYDNTISYLGAVNPETGMGTSHSDVNVIMWSWCGQVDNEYSAGTLYSDFLGPMAVLETTYPNVKFVYMTGHLDHTDEANNIAANDSIRRHCLREGKILYDFADIESYDPDGVYYGDLHPTDGCTYDASGNGSTSATGDPDIPVEGSGDRNWAIDWQNSHTVNIDWYSCSPSHTHALNGNQKAYAAWHMFVEIAKIIASEEIPEDLVVNDTIVANGESACFNATNTITVEGASAAVTFENGSSVNLIAGNSITLLPGFHAQAGSYTHAYITTDESYCFDLPANIVAAEPIAVKSIEETITPNKSNQIEKPASVKVYPNPNNGQFTLEFSNVESGATVCIYNMLGVRVYQSTATNETIQKINLLGMRRGIYIVKVIDHDEKLTKKLIVD